MTTMTWPGPSTSATSPADPGPWAGGVTAEDLAELAALATPLRRLLLMLGYQVDRLLAQAEPGDAWAQLDVRYFAASGVSGDAGPGDLPVSPGLVLALPAIAYLTPGADQGDPVPLGIPFADSPGVWTLDAEQGFLYIFGDDSAQSVQNRLTTSIEALTDALLAEAAEEVAAAPLTPAAAAGLLWLADPGTWFADPEAMRGSAAYRELESQAVLARDVITGSLGEEGEPLANFLTEQVTITATPRPDPPLPFFGARRRIPTLRELLYWVARGTFVAPYRAHAFFTNLESWLVERGQDGVLADGELDELRDAPWFAVIARLVDHGILLPPALISATDSDEEESPVLAERVDNLTVDLTVLHQMTIRLTLVRDADGAAVFPEPEHGEDQTMLDPIPQFTWDYLIPATTADLPRLVVVAAPGVDILVPTGTPVGWTLQIIRVQDTSLVPAWGNGVDPAQLLAQYVIPATNVVSGMITLPDQPPAAPAVQVLPHPDGMTLLYPSNTDPSAKQLVSVDIVLQGGSANAPLYSGDARFAVDVTYYHDDRGLNMPDPAPHITVWVTPGVSVTVTTTALTEFQDLRLQTEVWQVRDYTEIPQFGARLPFDTSKLEHFAGFAPGWEQPWTADQGSEPGRVFTALHVEHDEIGFTEWFTTVVDFGVGQIPLVGDVVDIADFSLAMATGRDKWGNPVSGGQLAMMGFAAMMPFVSGSLAEGFGRTIEGLTHAMPRLEAPDGAAARSAASLGVRSLAERALRPIGMSLADAERFAARAASFTSLTPAERADVVAELRAFITDNAAEFARASKGQVLSADELLDATGAGIRVPEAMREYGRWRADQLSAMLPGGGPPDLSIDNFIATVTAPRTRAMFEALLGNRAGGGAAAAVLHRSASAGARWKSTMYVLLRKTKPARTWLRDQIQGGALESAVEALVSSRTGQEARFGEQIWVDQRFLAYSEVVRHTAAEYAQYAAHLIDGLSGGNPGGITLETLGTLIGRKLSFYPGELARLVVTGLDVAEHELARSGRGLDDILQASGVARRIEGIQGFLHGIITSKGNEQGARFEVFLAGNEISKAVDVAIRMGARLPGILDSVSREGPDLLRYGADRLVADILQGKAYDSMLRLFSSVPVGNWMKHGAWRGPEVFRQLVSDIQRMANADPPFMLESLTGVAGGARFTGSFEFAIDVRHYLTTLSSIPSGLSEARIARLSNMSLNGLLNQLTDTDELLAAIDALKGIRSEEDIEAMLEAARPGVEDQLQAFLDLPNLADVLGITIPDGMTFSIELSFR